MMRQVWRGNFGRAAYSDDVAYFLETLETPVYLQGEAFSPSLDTSGQVSACLTATGVPMLIQLCQMCNLF